MNIWIIVDCIFSFVDSLLMFCFIDKFLARKKVDIKLIIFVIALQGVINYSTNQSIGIANLIGLSIMVFTTGILFSRLFKVMLVNIVFFTIVGIVMISLSEILTMVLIISITNTNPKLFFDNSLYRIIGAVISKTVIYLIVKNISLKTKFKISNYFNKTQIYQLSFILVVNILVVFLSIWFYRNSQMIKGNEKKYIVILSISIIIFTMAILSITKKIIEYAGKEAQWDEREKEYRRQMFYIKNTDDMFENLKAQRHDFNHHLGCIYGLINMKKYKELKDYIEKLTKEISEYNEILNTGNPILTSLLNVKMATAKNKGIRVEVAIDLNTRLSIEYIDLSIILGNLLDNAIESCEKVKGRDKNILVKINTKNNNLIIKIINTKQTELGKKINNERFTTKKDTDNHGFGLKNVNQIVKKYKGVIKIEEQKKLFKVNIGIPLNYDP